MIDIILLIAVILGGISIFEVGGLAWSAHNLSEKRITEKVRAGITVTLSDPRFQNSLINMMLSEKSIKLLSRALVKRMKAIYDGVRGFDEKQTRALAQTMIEPGENSLSPLLELLPKKTQEMIQKNPALIELALKFLPDILAKFTEEGGQNGR